MILRYKKPGGDSLWARAHHARYNVIALYKVKVNTKCKKSADNFFGTFYIAGLIFF